MRWKREIYVLRVLGLRFPWLATRLIPNRDYPSSSSNLRFRLNSKSRQATPRSSFVSLILRTSSTYFVTTSAITASRLPTPVSPPGSPHFQTAVSSSASLLPYPGPLIADPSTVNNQQGGYNCFDRYLSLILLSQIWRSQRAQMPRSQAAVSSLCC